MGEKLALIFFQAFLTRLSFTLCPPLVLATEINEDLLLEVNYAK